jgi:HPt (histidine-containing phosphotransfer) domain-containing protein
MIDWTRIKNLRDEVGAEDFDEVVEIFIEEVSEMIETLRAAPRADTLGEDLHALKGSALNLGFTDFSALCQKGETLAAQDRASEINLTPILHCYDRSKAAFLDGLALGHAT